MMSKSLRLVLNILTADDKYCLHKNENLPQPIQIQLSKKQKVFSKVFVPYLTSASHFEQ